MRARTWCRWPTAGRAEPRRVAGAAYSHRVFAHEAGSGTPVVLLHGFGLDHRSLLPLDPAFDRATGWRRIYLDLPGATATPAGVVASSQQVADAVVAEVRARVGDEPFAVLGNSFGGMIARHVAHELRGQVLGLATVAGVFVAPHGERTVPPRTVLRRDPAIEPLLGQALDQYREDAVVESTDDAEAFLHHVLPGLGGADRAALDRIAQRYSLDREPEDAHPEPFGQPALHITGRQDDVVGYSDAWRTIEHYPRASFAVLDAAGHNILAEQAALCSALITDWLHRMRRYS
jgi:pimeloyl-ACP methyl ester carboxylesterase